MLDGVAFACLQAAKPSGGKISIIICFVEILDYTWSKGIVPNYTKTGEAEPAVRIKMLHTNIDELGLEHPQLVLELIYLTYYNSRRPYS
ncbi:hypothetical protein Brsp07_04334 [Brucella sp. NBRC 14130]|uniref:hypothetical protein n=1 Tax=Brucella sp. NBRC 14130 TaxID=3075483 RepID=UPI0030A4CA01